eukprot:329520-Chlamydomonas_euryale.AAC.3
MWRHDVSVRQGRARQCGGMTAARSKGVAAMTGLVNSIEHKCRTTCGHCGRVIVCAKACGPVNPIQEGGCAPVHSCPVNAQDGESATIHPGPALATLANGLRRCNMPQPLKTNLLFFLCWPW